MVNQTIEKLHEMRLLGMAKAFEEQLSLPNLGEMCFEDRVATIVDEEFTYRENKKLDRRLKAARLKHPAAIEDINFKHPRGLDKSVILSLAKCHWIRSRQNVVIVGPTGVGKTYLSEALGNKACREGFTVLFQEAKKLFRELGIAREDGTHMKLLRKLKKPDLLVVDDFLLKPITEDDDKHDFLEIIEDRYDKGSTILTSQYPILEWHKLIGTPTLADAILDRIVHRSHKIILKGESMRKLANGPNDSTSDSCDSETS